MAKSADAADLKSADSKGLWGFKSPSRHHQRWSVGNSFQSRSFKSQFRLTPPQEALELLHISMSSIQILAGTLGVLIVDGLLGLLQVDAH